MNISLFRQTKRYRFLLRCFYYLEEVDTLDEVDTEDDDDTELEVDTLKKRKINFISLFY